MPRRATVSLVTGVLAVVTAGVVVRAAVVVGDPQVSSSAASNMETTVLGFYEAVNRAIRSGEIASLEALVAPGFVSHTLVPATTPDRAGLARSLIAIRTTFPDAQLVVDDLFAAGDRAIVRVSLHGVSRGAFVGLPLGTTPAIWGSLDGVRVSDERVVELWGGPSPPALLEPLGLLSLGARLPTRQVVALERLTYSPRSTGQAQADETRVLFVDSGALTIALDSRSPKPALLSFPGTSDAAGLPRTIAQGSERTLGAGMLVALLEGSRYAIRNNGAEPAEGFALTAFTLDAPGHVDPAYPDARLSANGPAVDDPGADAIHATDGKAMMPVAGGLTVALPSAPATVRVGRATLAPRGAIALGKAAGPALLYVEEGTLDLETTNGTAWVHRAVDETSRDVAIGTLAAGDGVLVQAGTTTALRNATDSPTVVFVVTITPDDATT